MYSNTSLGLKSVLVPHVTCSAKCYEDPLFAFARFWCQNGIKYGSEAMRRLCVVLGCVYMCVKNFGKKKLAQMYGKDAVFIAISSGRNPWLDILLEHLKNVFSTRTAWLYFVV